MKKSKNILLLVANGCFAIYFVWSMVRFLIHLVGATDSNSTFFLLTNEFYPALCLLLLMVLPVLLLVRNLKGKEGKAIPILSTTVYVVIPVLWLILAVTPAIPQYLIFSKLGLLDTYLIHILLFLSEGGWLLFAGYICTLIGSVLSLPKRNKKEEVTQ